MTSLDNLNKSLSQNSASYDNLDLLIDLIKQLLRIDPKRRPTPAEALRHPFFKGRSIIQPINKSRSCR